MASLKMDSSLLNLVKGIHISRNGRLSSSKTEQIKRLQEKKDIHKNQGEFK
jgi:hypothetical protein